MSLGSYISHPGALCDNYLKPNHRARPHEKQKQEMSDHPLLGLASRFFQAYNEVDSNRLTELLVEDVIWEHRNRFKGHGRKGLLDSIIEFSVKAPNRIFSEHSRWAVQGATLFMEHRWEGIPAIDVPGFGWKAGELVNLDCLSVLVFKEGKVVEWIDYA